ncbi:homoserine O-acetyltransferase [Sarocladium strictum]
MASSTIEYYDIPGFKFQDGSPATSVRLAYLDINPAATKVALIVTCFRGRLQSTLNFSDASLKNHRVIVAALFGNGESSSPSNMPAKSAPGMFDYRDCVRAQHQLVTSHLGINKLDVVLGFSMGGQCTYYWTLMYPDFVKDAVIICSSARTSRHNHQFLEGPKAALENSCDYEKGRPGSKRGLRAFGKAYSAWLTSAEWFEEEKYKTLGYTTLSDWDSEVAGESYYSWHPDDLLSKLRTWQNGDVTQIFKDGDSREELSLGQALAKIQARVLLMPCQTDQYFRWEASEKEAQHIPRVSLKVIPSIWGHVAGLGSNPDDKAWMNDRISEFLEGQD